MDLQIPPLAVDDAYRMGKIKGARPIMIKFISPKWVKMIFTKVKEISNPSNQTHKLRKIGFNAILRGDKILVDGATVQEDKIDSLLSKTNLEIQVNLKDHPKESSNETVSRHSPSDAPLRKEVENLT